MATLKDVTVERGTGMDVGCKRDALAAVMGNLRKAGQGAQRSVYVDARERFVYKIERSGYPGSNREEYEAFMSGELRERGLARFGSPVALYTVQTRHSGPVTVLAMPFRAQRSEAASPAEHERAAERGLFRLPDMHGANYRVTANGRIKITDLGFGVRRRGNW